MDIRIVKNSQGLQSKNIHKTYFLQTKEEDSEYNNIKRVNYYLYDLEKNESVEIEPAIKKYNLITVKDIKFQSRFVYFSTFKKTNDGNILIIVYRYHIHKKQSVVVYQFEEKFEKYTDYMRTRIFAVNEYYLFIQNEYLRANLTENYEDYFDFDLSMYSINEDKHYKVNDENLNRYGIIDFEPITSNICVLKQGFNLLKDNRYKILEKDEIANESVSFINIGQMVSDVLIGKQNLVMDTIENVSYTVTIPYVKVEDGYVIYSKVKLDKNLEEEIVFYNFPKKEAFMCINESASEEKITSRTCIIDNSPYIILQKQNGYEFINISEKKKDIVIDNASKIEYIKDSIMIVSTRTKGLFGKEKSYIMVYKIPDMKMLHREKGRFVACTLLPGEKLYIMTNREK